MTGPALRVAVVWAERAQQIVVELEVPGGTTAAEAVALSGIRARCPAIAADATLGVFGRQVTSGHRLEDGDRVELYRPLPMDPKVTRRELARRGLTMGPGRGPGGDG